MSKIKVNTIESFNLTEVSVNSLLKAKKTLLTNPEPVAFLSDLTGTVENLIPTVLASYLTVIGDINNDLTVYNHTGSQKYKNAKLLISNQNSVNATITVSHLNGTATPSLSNYILYNKEILPYETILIDLTLITNDFIILKSNLENVNYNLIADETDQNPKITKITTLNLAAAGTNTILHSTTSTEQLDEAEIYICNRNTSGVKVKIFIISGTNVLLLTNANLLSILNIEKNNSFAFKLPSSLPTDHSIVIWSDKLNVNFSLYSIVKAV